VRVLHVETRHRRGGAERNVANTIAWELTQGFEVHLAVGRDSIDDELPGGATIHVLPDLVRSVAPVRDIRAYRAVKELIGRHGFDVVHTHQSKAGVLGRLAARGHAPVILHTIHMASFGSAYNPIASIAFRSAERLCAPSTARIISVGRELGAMYLAAGIGKRQQYLLIRSPIDLSGFEAARASTSEERLAARRQLGLPPDAPVALVLASLEPRKRVALILRALAARASSGGIQLLIGGDGPEGASLEALAGRLGIASRVTFAGYLDDVVPAFKAADVLVHAATVEGVPQVVIQAFAAGIPVAATQMIGLREIDGAPVEVAEADGRDLDAAVGRALARPRGEVASSLLQQWAPESVAESLRRMYDAINEFGR
jgi:glycosyltransferase involved in cell wall biosynthesis